MLCMHQKPRLGALFARTESRPYKSRIERSSHRRVGRSLNDGAPVGKQCHRVRRTFEAKQEFVEADLTVRRQPLAHGCEVDGSMMLVDLHRVATAEGDVRSAFAGQMGKISLAAYGAARARVGGGDFGSFARPEIVLEERATH